ncbi:MAG: indole-3-glycerol phosphate synthase TrpC, partial [Syntrophomonadaceae bacterium]|nr:indole-3-glycerol phosphate synthase TrpC [Syntrophomonadaceae bacterium]
PFAAALGAGGRVTLIAEIKRASPSRGVLREPFDGIALARAYACQGAGAVSVITERRFFAGHPHLLGAVRESIDLPVLRKDFIIDERQLYETRLLGADAVLLIAALLGPALGSMARLAAGLGLETLVEVHDQEEVARAADTCATMIGINNRSLRDFSVDTRTCLRLAALVPAGLPRVAESGIRTPAHMRELEAHGFAAALVGEALVTATDPGAMVRQLAAYRE